MAENSDPTMEPDEAYEPSPDGDNRSNRCVLRRNLIGFWLLGLTNNFAYVIMLSAAHDILADDTQPSNSTNATTMAPPTNRSGKLIPECNPIGTGAILLADILPTLVVKMAAPLYIQILPYSVRVFLVIVFMAASFPIVAFAGTALVWLSLTGVVCASIGAGLGEITFLSLSTYFDKNSVSTWSSGTGAAGVFGALSYAGLTAVGVSPKTSLLLMEVIPVSMALSYYILIVKPPDIDNKPAINSSEEQPLIQTHSTEVRKYGLKERILLMKPLLKYMIPLGLVYFAEYFINQCLFELVYFEQSFLPTIQQYRWYQVIYQIGVFASRSSVNLIQIKHIWILAALQFANIAVVMCQIFFHYIPSIWIVFVIILYEGCLGGAAYVNTFFRISTEIPEETREYSMGVASVCNSIGIALAGGVAVPIRDLLCSL